MVLDSLKWNPSIGRKKRVKGTDLAGRVLCYNPFLVSCWGEDYETEKVAEKVARSARARYAQARIPKRSMRAMYRL